LVLHTDWVSAMLQLVVNVRRNTVTKVWM